MKKLLAINLMFVALNIHAQEKKFSHWSVTIEGVLNKFDGDISQPYNHVIPNSLTNLSVGVTAEYSFTPVWSMGIDYYYLPIRAHGEYYSLRNSMHNIGVFSAFNLIKWFYPESTTKWGCWGTIGVGLANYNVNYQTQRDGMLNTTTGLVDYNSKLRNGKALYLPIGALLEYNITDQFTLGTKIQCRGFNKDNLDGRNYCGVTNDFVELATVQLRWKFKTARQAHMRNINTAQRYAPQPAPTVLIERVPTIPDNQLHESVQALNEELKDLKTKLNNLEKAQQQNDSLLSAMALKTTNATYMWTGSIYFNFDKTTLDADAEMTIRRIASEMQLQPSLLLKIVGTADYEGHSKYNQQLSSQRAERIKMELLKLYQIQPERITTCGIGPINEPKAAIRQNRRCDFYFNK